MPILRELPNQLSTPFSVALAREHGVTERRLRGPDLSTPFHGVRANVAPTGGLPSPRSPAARALEWRQQHLELIEAFECIRAESHFYAGVSAAVLLGLPLPATITWRAPNDVPLEVATLRGSCPPQRRGVRGRRFRPAFVRVIRQSGVPMIDPATTWIDVALRLRERDAVALGDAIVRIPRHPGRGQAGLGQALSSVEEIAKLVAVRGRQGRTTLEERLRLIRQGSASVPETHLRLLLRSWRLPEPVLDLDICDKNGRFVGCSELAYPDVRLALEYEGDHHRTDAYQWNRDIEKYRDYAALGWEVIRVTAELQYQRWPVLRDQVVEAFVRRGGVLLGDPRSSTTKAG